MWWVPGREGMERDEVGRTEDQTGKDEDEVEVESSDNRNDRNRGNEDGSDRGSRMLD
jgi:hypothetical protein